MVPCTNDVIEKGSVQLSQQFPLAGGSPEGSQYTARLVLDALELAQHFGQAVGGQVVPSLSPGNESPAEKPMKWSVNILGEEQPASWLQGPVHFAEGTLYGIHITIPSNATEHGLEDDDVELVGVRYVLSVDGRVFDLLGNAPGFMDFSSYRLGIRAVRADHLGPLAGQPQGETAISTSDFKRLGAAEIRG